MRALLLKASLKNYNRFFREVSLLKEKKNNNSNYVINFLQLTDRHHGPTGIVRQQAEPAVGHERGVDPAGKGIAADDTRDHTDASSTGIADNDVNVVPVRTAGASEHVALAHRGVPSGRTSAR